MFTDLAHAAIRPLTLALQGLLASIPGATDDGRFIALSAELQRDSTLGINDGSGEGSETPL